MTPSPNEFIQHADEVIDGVTNKDVDLEVFKQSLRVAEVYALLAIAGALVNLARVQR